MTDTPELKTCRRASPWQPIETAYENGKGVAFLAYSRFYVRPVTVQIDPSSENIVSIWDGEEVIESQTDFGTNYMAAGPFTHWMPLPEPPEVEK